MISNGLMSLTAGKVAAFVLIDEREGAPPLARRLAGGGQAVHGGCRDGCTRGVIRGGGGARGGGAALTRKTFFTSPARPGPSVPLRCSTVTRPDAGYNYPGIRSELIRSKKQLRSRQNAELCCC